MQDPRKAVTRLDGPLPNQQKITENVNTELRKVHDDADCGVPFAIRVVLPITLLAALADAARPMRDRDP